MIVTLTVKSYFELALHNVLQNCENPTNNSIKLIFHSQYKEIMQLYLKKFKQLDENIYDIAGNKVSIVYIN